MEAFVLTGGESRRFGSNKALYEVGGEPLLATLCKRLALVLDRVRIVAKETDIYTGLGYDVLPDVREEQCPLVGIYSGLRALGAGKAFFAACDLPLVNPDLVRYIVRESSGYDAAVPRTAKGVEPLCAVYDVRCLPSIEAALDSGRLKADSFFSAVKTKIIDEKDLREHDPRMVSFWNVNTPRDMPFVIETIARERTKRCS